MKLELRPLDDAGLVFRSRIIWPDATEDDYLTVAAEGPAVLEDRSHDEARYEAQKAQWEAAK